MERDRDRTRERLLEAGFHEFARHGLEGARVNRIASLSGVSKQGIYAYFGGKDGLFAAVVLEKAIGPVVDVRFDATGLPGYVDRLANLCVGTPDVLPLLHWAHLFADPATERNLQKAYEDQIAAICIEQGRGRIRDDIGAATVLAAIWSALTPAITFERIVPVPGGSETYRAWRGDVESLARILSPTFPAEGS